MSAKSIVIVALRDDSAVMALVPDGPSQGWHNTKARYPQITVTRTAETGEYHGDNDTANLGTAMQIDIWGKASTTDLETEVKRVIKELGEHVASPLRSVGDTSYDEEARIYRNTFSTIIYE